MTDVRDRLALALDVGGAADAERVARRLVPWFGIAKVGLELYGEAGPDIFERLRALGFAIFADLKLYDIPTTVERAARVLGRRGVDFLNFPAAGGAAMLEAGVTGLADGARDGGHQPPRALAVTVLTSETDVSAFDARLEAAATAGCDGVVCSRSRRSRHAPRTSRRWCPASVFPARRGTTRPEWRRPRRHSGWGPTGSSSAGR